MNSSKNLSNRQNDLLQEQLIEAQRKLFFVTSIREVKFLQNKIAYLKSQMKEIKKKR